ncbi:MAG: HAMP domain-containing histidine kinase [Oscillospiraceae bacterium]|nr:HAMP domain-containing histidine kinase [Oscillospiraceae bacterium]
MKKTKIRRRILAAFSAVLFFSFALTGVIFNIAIRLLAVDREYNNIYDEASRIVGRTGIILFVLISIMFVVAVIVTYFLSNSITQPIEKLGKFALNIGHGSFTPNDFDFKDTELDALNTALNNAVKQLAVYDSEQKAFFQNASHELRTPLMSIKCYAEGIAFGLMEPTQASETILQETDKLSDLVTDLLYISKIDNITTAYHSAEADLTEIIRNCAMRQHAMAKKQQLRLSFDFGEDAVLYECIAELISRAVDNLLSNAIRYAGAEITLSCHRTRDHIIIRVADDGDGIDPEALPHVFERFYKGTDGNHGIGLSIVKSIATQHGGHVTAENSNKGGAVFTITLPL